MPECAIGLFPDVGTTHFLAQRLRGATGAWLGLTGARLTGADTWHAGVATHYVPSADLPALLEALRGGGGRRRGWLGRALGWRPSPPAPDATRFASSTLASLQARTPLPPPSPALCPPVRAAMDACFGRDKGSVAAVRAALEEAEAAAPGGSPVRAWAAAALAGLARGSPYSLALTLALLADGARTPLGAALRLEWRAVLAALAGPGTDFCVGVTARLVDKGARGEPVWGRGDVSAAVAAALAPLEPGEELDLTGRGGGDGGRARL